MKNQIKTVLEVAGVFLGGAMLLLSLIFLQKPPQVAIGSVSQGGDYHATTTVAVGFLNNTPLVVGPGAFGSLIITGVNTGIINLYDATTTNGLLRTVSATSSLTLLATFPASTATGTYTFDEIFQQGLLPVITGTTPTSTITYRQY